MLEPTTQALLKGRVILASGSPSRHEIIKNLGINAECVASMYDENLERAKYASHGEYVQELAYYKVQEVWERLKQDETPPSIVIGADTVVTLGDTIYGKPKNESDALHILSCLANKRHTVYTGVCLKTPKVEIIFHESTNVKFGDLSEEQLRVYVKTGEPLDKAGGYGIQGVGGCLIEKIEGDYYTVVGIPLYSLIRHLNKIFAD